MEHGVPLSGSRLDVSSLHNHSDPGRFLNLLPGMVSAVAEAHITGGQKGSGTQGSSQLEHSSGKTTDNR